MRALSHAAMAKGAAGVMIAPPPSLRTDDQIVTYYAQAADAIGSDIPFVIQDYPLALGVIMTSSVIRRIITDNPSCVMFEARGLAGPGKDFVSSAIRAGRASCAASRFSLATAAFSSISRWSAELMAR